MSAPETVTLKNGRTVTAGTAWWVKRLSGKRDALPGLGLYCVHDVALARACEQCNGKTA